MNLNDCIDWVNIMLYDTNPEDFGITEPNYSHDKNTYIAVLNTFKNYIDKDKIIMGF